MQEADDVGLWDWMRENGSILESILKEHWAESSHDNWLTIANIMFPPTKTSIQDEIRKFIRMVYWNKMLNHECMMDLIHFEPFSFITSPEEMELVYTMGKLDCLVPLHLQRHVWCEEHELGKEPVVSYVSAVVTPSSQDSYDSLISNLENWTPVSDGVTAINSMSPTGAIPKKTPRKDKKTKVQKSLVTDDLSELAQVETRKLIVSTAKKMSKISQEDKPKDPEDFLGASELPDKSIKHKSNNHCCR